MSRATIISRVVFGLLVLLTLTAFFVAQRLKRTEPLVYAVQMKKYISPNADGLRERGYLRFRTKQTDDITVEVIDRTQTAIRTLADDRELGPGVHRFFWNGRRRADGRRTAAAVPDGAYRVRISLRRAGRTFIPDKYFVVDTVAPRLTANVVGAHTVSALDDRPRAVDVRFTGVEPGRRAEFEVYAVRGGRTAKRPVAAFVSDRGKATGSWKLEIGHFRRRVEPCFGRLARKGSSRPAPVGKYVIVAKACDAAGNIGFSSERMPPVRGSGRGKSGVTLRGIEIAPPMGPLIAGRRASIALNPPIGGYRYVLRDSDGGAAVRGRARGRTLRLTIPRRSSGLHTLQITALRRQSGRSASATAPLVIRPRKRARLMVIYPSLAWQAENPIDVDGDGFPDNFTNVDGGGERRVRLDRTIAGGRLPAGFSDREQPLARFLGSLSNSPHAMSTTDHALAQLPKRQLVGVDAVLFAGDERWITPQLGLALHDFVERGGRVAFFAPDAFRRTVRIAAGSMTGPSQRSDRDIFGESIETKHLAPAPVIGFADTLGLLRGPTGLFTLFEESRSRARTAEVLTAAGRQPGKPALVAYRLGKGLVIRVGLGDWQSRLVASSGASGTAPPDQNVVFTTQQILRQLTR